MTVRGTANYVFYVEQMLGAGSTGIVYFGRHKRKGDPCACKLFTCQDSRTKVQVKENELEYMRRLDHPNIVHCLAIETDTRTKETVLVMELCAEGSLQKIISEPENCCGLPEDLFRDFFSQFVQGLSYLLLHGIAHRDVKPGNILCCKNEFGRITFKLTDFGATKDLANGSGSSALYGTEEYLHPEIYRRAVLEKVATGTDFESNAEIWSIGVTLYQVATGQLPFQAYGGRNNRSTMYKIISEKEFGVISGIQSTSNGQIVYSKELPSTCALSLGLKRELEPIIARTIEKDTQLQWAFDQFFPACESLSRSCVVIVFSAISGKFHRIYLSPNKRLKDFQEKLCQQTTVDECDQTLLYQSRLLVEQIQSDTAIEHFPATSEENPIVLISLCGDVARRMKYDMPKLPDRVQSNGNNNMAADCTLARDASAAFYRILSIATSLTRSQKHCNCCKVTLTNMLLSRLRLVSDDCQSLKLLIDSLAVELSIAQIEQVQHRPGFSDERALSSHASTSSVRLLSNDGSDCSSLLSELHTKCSDIQRTCERIIKSVESLRAKAPEQPLICAPLADCEQKCCIGKFRQKTERSRAVYLQFTEDKKRQMSYNDDQIHKYDRIKLLELLDTVIAEIKAHCLAQTLRQHQDFRDWLCSWYLTFKSDVEKVEGNTKRLRLSVHDLTDRWRKLTQSANEGSFENFDGPNVATDEQLKKVVNLLDEEEWALKNLILERRSYENQLDSVIKTLDTNKRLHVL